MHLIDLLRYSFFQNALLGSLLASIVCGIIGSYIVVRRLVFISGGITHSSLGGIGMGFYFGINPILGAVIFSILSAFGIEWLSGRQGVREDSAIGTLWSLGMSIGIIFIYLTPGYAPNLNDYLFGNILIITSFDIYGLLILSAILIFTFSAFKYQILFSSFDSEYYKTRNLPINMIKYTMIMLIALSIVLCIRLVGIVLLMSLLTVPQMTANLFTSNFNKMIYLAIFFCFIGCVIGLLMSVILDAPSGVFIIFTQIIIFILAKIFFKFNFGDKENDTNIA